MNNRRNFLRKVGIVGASGIVSTLIPSKLFALKELSKQELFIKDCWGLGSFKFGDEVWIHSKYEKIFSYLISKVDGIEVSFPNPKDTIKATIIGLEIIENDHKRCISRYILKVDDSNIERGARRTIYKTRLEAEKREKILKTEAFIMKNMLKEKHIDKNDIKARDAFATECRRRKQNFEPLYGCSVDNYFSVNSNSTNFDIGEEIWFSGSTFLEGYHMQGNGYYVQDIILNGKIIKKDVCMDDKYFSGEQYRVNIDMKQIINHLVKNKNYFPLKKDSGFKIIRCYDEAFKTKKELLEFLNKKKNEKVEFVDEFF